MLGRAAALAAVGGTRGVATGTSDNELALTPKTGFAFSTCTEVLLKIGDSEGSRLMGLTRLRLPVVPKSCGLSRMRPC